MIPFQTRVRHKTSTFLVFGLSCNNILYFLRHLTAHPTARLMAKAAFPIQFQIKVSNEKGAESKRRKKNQNLKVQLSFGSDCLLALCKIKEIFNSKLAERFSNHQISGLASILGLFLSLSICALFFPEIFSFYPFYILLLSSEV